MTHATRTESDCLGTREVPRDALYGIHTLRASENFYIAGRPVQPSLISAYGTVKLAAATVNRSLGLWPDPAVAGAIMQACREMQENLLDRHIIVDALQGGAGTSLNMNVNEVLANRAGELLGYPPGTASAISPLDDINAHQSTNDTFPTALRCAAIHLLHDLEQEVLALQEAFQQKEKECADVVKIGRTQLQDAVLTTLGREMSAYAECFNRDRWRIYKCEERLRVVNLGGTAIGSGLGAPRTYIFQVVDTLRDLTGIGFARAENLTDATQNVDVCVEVSGILKACAASLIKVANDLRLLSSGPDGGIGEIHLPPVQAGSSIMPHKVNPVIPEAVVQGALMVIGWDGTLTAAAAAGCLELNHTMPLITDCLLQEILVLTRCCRTLRTGAVAGLKPDRERCRSTLESATATVTALTGVIGYEQASRIAQEAAESGQTIRAWCISHTIVTAEEFDNLVTPEAVCRLGSPSNPRKGPHAKST